MSPVSEILEISAPGDSGGWSRCCLTSCSIPGAGFSLAIPILVVFLVFDALWVKEEDFLQGSDKPGSSPAADKRSFCSSIPQS